MIFKPVFPEFREYWANSRINYSIRVFIALVGVILPSGWFGITEAITPLVLGIIASALAETDDNFSGRLSALLITLLCFSVAIFSVEFLFQTPLLFALGLLLSSFSFIMLGAIGPRYASIAFASLLIAVYTMLGEGDASATLYKPFLLLSGAFWYGFISLVWLWFWPFQPVQQNLANVFTFLSRYLKQKNDLFFPSKSRSLQDIRILDANENAIVVNALNQAKRTLLNRVRVEHLNESSRHLLKVYFLAQDIHERANAMQSNIQELTQAFFHSDVMFRLQHVLRLQAKACLDISHALRLSTPYIHLRQSTLALNELNKSIEFIHTHGNPTWKALISQVEYHRQNLATIEQQLSNVGQIERSNKEKDKDKEITDTDAHNTKEKIARVRAELNVKSLLFRHAIRLSLTLCAGYGIIQFFNLTHGYWILLTTLFVCNADYSTTRSKLTQRIKGTLVGLIIGIPLLSFFPNITGQLVLMVLFGVLFFAFRITHYATATTFITLLVLLCFNQQGEGYNIMLPRLTETIIGCLLSVAAVRFILPDWQAHRLHGIMKDAISANRDYLAQIIAQYRIGKRDSVTYRLARRQAHNNDAKLSSTISNMLAEPGRYQSATDESFRFLCLNHTLLSYISTLGAHRLQIEDGRIHALVSKVHREIHQELNYLIQKFSGLALDPPFVFDESLEKELERWHDEKDSAANMILQQLRLIHQLMPEMHKVTEIMALKALKNSTTLH